MSFEIFTDSSASLMPEQIEKHHITSFCAPPTIYRFLIQEDLTQYDFSSCLHWSTAGEPLSEEVFNKWKEITGKEIREGFGQTETTLSLFNYGNEPIKPATPVNNIFLFSKLILFTMPLPLSSQL